MPVGPVSDLFHSMMISMHFGGSYYNIMVITDTNIYIVTRVHPILGHVVKITSTADVCK